MLGRCSSQLLDQAILAAPHAHCVQGTPDVGLHACIHVTYKASREVLGGSRGGLGTRVLARS